MKEHLKHISKWEVAFALFMTLIFLVADAKGQVSPTASFHMERDGGVKWNDCAADIGSIYDITQAKATFGSFYTRYMAEKQVDPVLYANHTDANFLKINEWVATWNNYVWSGHAAGHIHPETGKLIPCQSRVNIESGCGRYAVDYLVDFAFGRYTGQGNSKFYNGGTIAQGSTELYVDHANWVGEPNNHSIFKGATWGREDLSSYQEAFYLANFRLDGAKTSEAYNSAMESSGIITWDPGSASHIEGIFAENFNTAGLHCVRGTSLSVGTSTWFRCNLAGVWLQGGGMHCFDGVQEFDENPTCFLINGGHGRDGGSVFECLYAKTESGIAPARETDKDETLVDGEGWGVLHFGTVSYSNVDDIQYTMIRWNGNVNSSAIGIDKLRIWGGLFNVMHDLFNNKVCRTDCGTNYGGCWFSEIHDFEWSGQNGGKFQFKFIQSPNVISNVSDARYESLPVDPQSGNMIGAYNEATGYPPYKYGHYGGSTTTPVQCKWDTTAWGACNGSIQTRSVTLSPAGCTGTPAGVKPSDTRACTNTAPGVKWKSPWTSPLVLVRNGTAKDANGKTLDQSWCTPVTATGVTIVEIKGLKCTELNWGRIIGVGGTSGGLQISNTGEWWWANAKMNPQPKKVMKDVTADYVITIPSSNIVAAPQTSCGQGGAQIGTIGSITLK